MKRKTYYIIAAVWFVMLLVVIAACFLPIVDAYTQSRIKSYLIWVVLVGGLAMILLRRMVDDYK